jgi:hypothetical protein
MMECYYRARCDHCSTPVNEDYATLYESGQLAKAAADAAGWVYVPNAFATLDWVCPDCQKYVST